jgi:tetratricopeptide (TPR) repeat protein
MTSRLLASCCFVCLLAPVASLAHPQQNKTGNPSDSPDATVSVRQLRIPERAKSAFNKGTQKLAAKDYAGSIAEFQKAIAAYDDFYEAYYKIGIANLEMQACEAAEAAFRRSIALSESKYTPSLFGMGLALASQKQFADAETYVRTGLQIEPTSPSGLLALGWVLFSAQRVVEAEKAAREAILYNPNLAMAHLLLAQIHREQNNSAAMVNDLDAYLRLEPEGPRSRALRTTRDAVQQTLNDTPVAKPDDSLAPTIVR